MNETPNRVDGCDVGDYLAYVARQQEVLDQHEILRQQGALGDQIAEIVHALHAHFAPGYAVLHTSEKEQEESGKAE